jgi:riboflavin biosynthesis pyrimidine reductase
VWAIRGSPRRRRAVATEGGTACEHPAVQVILPAAREADVDELYGLPRPRPVDRPWVAVCMIASLDGSTVVEGRSGGLGNVTDGAVFGALRRAADVVIVGAATARAESYGPPKQAGLRIGVVTASGAIDPTGELFTSGSGFLVMPEDGPPAPGTVDVVRAGHGRVDVSQALQRLDQVVPDARFVQAEGGAHLNGALLASDCVDELNLTLAPALVGGDGPRLTAGSPAVFRRFDLVHLATDDNYLYGRWVRGAG